MGFTTDLLTGLAQRLALADVGAWDPDGIYHPTQTGIFLGTVPLEPDRCITLTSYQVEQAAERVEGVTAVQVRIRAGRDPRDMDDLADAVFDQLHGLNEVTLSSAYISVMWRETSLPMGVDANNRHERADNYYARTARASLNFT